MTGAADSSGTTSRDGSMSTVSKAEVVEDYVGVSEVSSYPKGDELELGLGLGLGPKIKSNGYGEYCRILTANDFPSIISPSLPKNGVAGTKRAADSVAQDVGSNSPSQVVGWPPIRAYRMNSLVSQAKAPLEDGSAEISGNADKTDVISKMSENSIQVKGNAKTQFVKVNMDGAPIGRKVDLNAHACYQTLAQVLEDMFCRPTHTCLSGVKEHEVKAEAAKTSKLLDGSSEFVLTYEDREGDWMLVGDVPWRMFLSTVKRLRIMRTSEANGLAPRFENRGDPRQSKPV